MMTESLNTIPALPNVTPICIVEIVELTLSPDPIQRYFAAKTMAHLGPTDCAFVPALHHLLQDQEFNVRLAACDALSEMGSGAIVAVTGLCRLLKDKTIGVRQHAARALHALSPLPRSTHESLAMALTDFNPKVREHAAAALAMSQSNDLHAAA
jgi:HEAT repeat protein